MKFENKKVIEQLKKTGWKENRIVSKEIKYPLIDYPNSIKEFMKNICFLKIQDIEYKNDYQTYVPSFLEFDPMLGDGHYDSDGDFTYYISLLKKQIYCIGYYSPDGYYICCDADGRVYMIGEYCYYRGKNLSEGIENILLGWDNCLQLDEDTGKWWNEHTQYVDLQ
jgi:hypothetical protein